MVPHGQGSPRRTNSVEVRGCVGSVQILANNTIIAVHRRNTPEQQSPLRTA